MKLKINNHTADLYFICIYCKSYIFIHFEFAVEINNLGGTKVDIVASN